MSGKKCIFAEKIIIKKGPVHPEGIPSARATKYRECFI